MTDLAVLGADPRFGGGALAQMEAFWRAAVDLGRDAVVRLRRPSQPRRRPARRVAARPPGPEGAVRPPRRGEPARRRPAARARAARRTLGLGRLHDAPRTATPRCAAGAPYALLDRNRAWPTSGPGRRPGLPASRRLAIRVNAPGAEPARAARPAEARAVSTRPRRGAARASPARADSTRSASGILPIPVDLDAFSPAPDDGVAEDDRAPVLAFVGRADDSRKNVRLLFDALPLLPGARLLLIGSPPRGPAPGAGRGDGRRRVGRPPPAPGDAVRAARRTRRASGSRPPRRSPPGCRSSPPRAAGPEALVTGVRRRRRPLEVLARTSSPRPSGSCSPTPAGWRSCAAADASTSSASILPPASASCSPRRWAAQEDGVIGISLLTLNREAAGGTLTFARELVRALARVGELEYRVFVPARRRRPATGCPRPSCAAFPAAAAGPAGRRRPRASPSRPRRLRRALRPSELERDPLPADRDAAAARRAAGGRDDPRPPARGLPRSSSREVSSPTAGAPTDRRFATAGS